MINQHYGTLTIIRQCVTTGMLAQHNGQAWRVSAVRGKHVYLHNLRESVRITDCTVDVFLNGRGDPITEVV